MKHMSILFYLEWSKLYERMVLGAWIFLSKPHCPWPICERPNRDRAFTMSNSNLVIEKGKDTTWDKRDLWADGKHLRGSYRPLTMDATRGLLFALLFKTEKPRLKKSSSSTQRSKKLTIIWSRANSLHVGCTCMIGQQLLLVLPMHSRFHGYPVLEVD